MEPTRNFSFSTVKIIGMLIVLIFIIALLLWNVFPSMTVEAADEKIIFVDAKAEGENNGSSWEDAYIDLHEAIEAADTGDQIWIAKGTYVPTGNGEGRAVHFEMRNGVEIYGGFAGIEDPATFNLNVRDFINNETILSGDRNGNDVEGDDATRVDNVYRVFSNSHLDHTAVLDGVTIQGSYAADGNRGSGMFNEHSSPTLRNLIIRDNKKDNTTTYSGGMTNLNSSPTLINVSISGNSAMYGGGIYNENSSPTLMNVRIEENNGSSYGGGIYNQNSNPKLENVSIIGNSAGTFGGAIYNDNSSPTLMNVSIIGNSAGSGGGIYNHDSSPTLLNVSIIGNGAGSGGGICNSESSNLQLTNVLISGNFGRDWGNGIYNISGGNLVLTNVTISGNSGDGNAIDNHSGHVTIRNSIVWGNSYDSIDMRFLDYFTIEDSLLQYYNEDLYGNPHIDSIFEHQVLDDEAPTTEGDYRLKRDSVAIGAGNNSYYEEESTPDLSHITTDLGDNPRFQGIVDLGAYESTWFRVSASPVEGGSVEGAGTYDNGEIVTVRADANAGYTFVNWAVDGEEEVSTEEEFTFTMTSDLVANFVLNDYDITVEANLAAGGDVDGAGTYFHGEMVTVEATANPGYTFVNWTESGKEVSTEAVYTFPVFEDRVLVANFVDLRAPSIELDYLPKTWTKDEVAIKVNATDAGSGVAVVKWDAGSVDAAHFADKGKVVSVGVFHVSSNGTYTVYARDAAGNEAVAEIVISNIYSIVPNLKPTITPTGPTNGEVKISVTADVYGTDSGNTLTKLNWLEGSYAAADFAGGANGADILAEMEFTVTTNGTYTVYAQDALGSEAVTEIVISNIFTDIPGLTLVHAPIGPTKGEVTIHVTFDVHGSDSGNAQDKLNWLKGSHAAADFAGGISGEDILSTGQFVVTSNGTYTVYARDLAGNEAVAQIVITTIQTPAPSGGGYRSSFSDNDDSPVTEPTEDGRRLKVDASMTTIETLGDGTVIEMVQLDTTTLGKIVEELIDSGKPVLTVRVDDQEDGVQLRLPASFIQSISASVDQAIIHLRLNGSSYQLAIQVLDVEAIAAQMGVNLEDLELSLIIAKANDETVEDVMRVASAQGITVVSDVIDFKIIAKASGRSMEISEFGGMYMPRSIVTDGGSQYQTGVIYDPVTQTFSFTPSYIHTQSDGTKEAMLFAPHNSLYLVIQSDGKTFADIQGHWAQADIEALASKLIINGVSDTEFIPGDDITRAEFTALLVRALGLSSSEQRTESRFVDVDEKAWYAQMVEIAAEVGLVQGVGGEYFEPNKKITREQSAVMVYYAMKLVGATTLAHEADDVLGKYTDHDQISEWAKQAVAETSAAEVFQGYPDQSFAPQHNVTRAEAAVTLKRFLQAVEFMD